MKTLVLILTLVTSSILCADFINEAEETASRVVQSLKETYSEARTYVSHQYYKQTIKLTLHAQEGDFKYYKSKFDDYPFWKKAIFFYRKISANMLNDDIIESGEKCLKQLDTEPFEEELFKQEYENFLELRNEFIAKFETYQR